MNVCFAFEGKKEERERLLCYAINARLFSAWRQTLCCVLVYAKVDLGKQANKKESSQTPVHALIQNKTKFKEIKRVQRHKVVNVGSAQSSIHKSLRNHPVEGLVRTLPELVTRSAFIRSRGAFAVLDDPGMSLDVFEGDAFLGVQDEELCLFVSWKFTANI